MSASMEVAKYVKRLEPVTASKLAKVIGQPVKTTERLLKAAEKDGLVTCRRRGRSIFWATPVKAETNQILRGETVSAEVYDDKVIEDEAETVAAETIALRVCDDDETVFEVRVGGKKLGEVAETSPGGRVRWMVVSPFSPKTYERLTDAIRVGLTGSGE